MGFPPAADAAPDLIKLTGSVLVTVMRHDSRMIGQAKEKAQLFDIHLRATQQSSAILGVGRLHHRHHQIHDGGLHPIAQQKFVIARQFLHDLQQPRVEAENLLRQDLAGGRLFPLGFRGAFGLFVRHVSAPAKIRLAFGENGPDG